MSLQANNIFNREEFTEEYSTFRKSLYEYKGHVMSTLDSGEKPTILVVDDTPDNLTLVSNLLKKDYRVRVAINGEKALKIAFSETPPDLILLVLAAV